MTTLILIAYALAYPAFVGLIGLVCVVCTPGYRI